MSTWSGGRILTQKQREEKRKRDRLTKRRRKQAAEKSTLAIRNELEYLKSLVEGNRNDMGNQTQRPGADDDLACSALAICPVVRSSHDATLEGRLFPDLTFYVGGPDLYTPLQHTSTHVRPGAGRIAAGDLILREFNEASSTSLVKRFNNIFARVHQIDLHNICLDERSNQDALIRGVLDGWSHLDYRSQRCPLWDILREVDEALFAISDIMTRLSMLRAVHFLLLFFVGGWSWAELPSWLRPRPSQLQFPHPLVVDYFAWPGLRERFCLTGSEAMNNNFWAKFALSFRLNWPYGSHVSYCVKAPGVYQFTSLFEKTFRDITAWMMGSDFFDAFPEMCDDIMPSRGYVASLDAEG